MTMASQNTLNDRLPLLDHGYLRFVESWGSDERIIESARMSTDKGFQGWGPTHDDNCTRRLKEARLAAAYRGLADAVEATIAICTCTDGPKAGDEKLLSYLWEHRHHTPFEMAGLTIEVQAPIMVFREWHRHRTQSYNELSARYTALPDLYYLPSVERVMAGKQATTNKQSSEAGFTAEQAESVRLMMRYSYNVARESYEHLLAQGVARELARTVIPVAQYSRMRASANLRNWLAFLTLRNQAGAQWEIRQYAHALATMIAVRFPRTYEVYCADLETA